MLNKLDWPTAVFCWPVVTLPKLFLPTAVFLIPEVLDVNASKPTAVFAEPVTAASKAFSPRTVFSATEFAPLPTLIEFMVASLDIFTFPDESITSLSVASIAWNLWVALLKNKTPLFPQFIILSVPSCTRTKSFVPEFPNCNCALSSNFTWLDADNSPVTDTPEAVVANLGFPSYISSTLVLGLNLAITSSWAWLISNFCPVGISM